MDIFVAPASVPVEYYEKIARFAAEQDSLIDETEDWLEREQESFDTFVRG